MTNCDLPAALSELAPSVDALSGHDISAIISSMSQPVVGELKIASDPALFLWLRYAEDTFWQPIRLMLKNHGERSRGLPEKKVNVEKMCAWCSEFCTQRWVVENRSITLDDNRDYGATFWFENGRDAYDFTLKWVPFKCT